MNRRKYGRMVIVFTVIIYYVLAFCGFSLLRHFGILYSGGKIHIYAIPMMVVISGYVYWINGKRIFRKEDMIPEKENLLLYLIPYVVVAAVLLSIAETMIMKRSLPDILGMAVLTFLIGVSEEGMFRLFLLKYSEGSIKRKILLYMFSAVTFAALHMMNIGGGLSLNDALVQSINAMPFGLAAGLLFLRTGNISSLIFWHMFFDYDLFSAQLGLYLTTTIASFIVDWLVVLSLARAVIQMAVEHWRKNRWLSR